MACAVKDIAGLMQAWAPLGTAEERDNVGLLVGFFNDAVNMILIALDIDEGVLAEAARLHAELIIAHHPLIYRPLNAVTDGTAEGRLVALAIKAGIGIYAAHTNLDRAAGGVNDALCQALGWKCRQAEEGFIARIVEMEQDTTLEKMAKAVREKLGSPVARVTGEPGCVIRSLYVVSGSGKHDVGCAKEHGCDALLTGEIDYHAARSAKAMGLAVIEAGHYYSERPVLYNIEKHLQKETGRLKYNIRTEVYKPATCPFWFITD